jgi:hypothetical protein
LVKEHLSAGRVSLTDIQTLVTGLEGLLQTTSVMVRVGQSPPFTLSFGGHPARASWLDQAVQGPSPSRRDSSTRNFWDDPDNGLSISGSTQSEVLAHSLLIRYGLAVLDIGSPFPVASEPDVAGWNSGVDYC